MLLCCCAAGADVDGTLPGDSDPSASHATASSCPKADPSLHCSIDELLETQNALNLRL